ncbi:MAG: class I SAM-dependent methyltransferase [Alphaproteobacteria bacterium]
MTKLIDFFHKNFIFDRRTIQLSNHILSLLETNTTLLDVGCGDGTIASIIASNNKKIEVYGIDVLIREKTKIPVTLFDGEHIPFPDSSFDYISFIDVLHHTHTAEELLSESLRVARMGVIIKDHICKNKLDYLFLKFMDDVGNKRFKIALPYNYLSKTEWQQLFKKVHAKVQKSILNLNLYPYRLNSSFIGLDVLSGVYE